MVPDVALILLGGGFAAAAAIAGLLLTAPVRLRVYAHPNARSFHQQSTPTSGGVAFVLPLVAYLAWIASHGVVTALALTGGGAVLAAVGLWDDVWEISRWPRLGVQTIVAAVVAWSILEHGADGAGPDAVGGWLLMAVVALALVWHVNLYNFMDGIDGLAGAQALIFAVGAQIVGLGLSGWAGDLLWLLTGSVLGFLVFNWPRARIFMGDVGSYFLGLLIAAVAVLSWRQEVLPLEVSLVLLCGFWFDATYTLIVRASTGQPFTQPHRTHLYQKVAARRGHLWTTVCFLLYGALWLLPLAWLCSRHGSGSPPWTILWLLLAVTPLAVAAWHLRAGLPDPEHERRD